MMKNILISGLRLTLAIAFGISHQLAYAQTQLYPRDEELQKLMPDFRRQVEYWHQYEEPERQREARAFAENWSGEPTVAQNTGNSRSPAQKIQQSQQTIPIVTTADLPPGFNIPIAIPTYLPSGFYLKEFQAFDAGYVGQDAFHYSITYEEVDNSTCLEISSGIDGTSFESLGLSETSVKLSQGEVTVYSGNVEGKPMIIALDWGKQIGLPSSNYRMTLISGYDSSGGGSCNPVSMEEFIQVLQSMKPLK